MSRKVVDASVCPIRGEPAGTRSPTEYSRALWIALVLVFFGSQHLFSKKNLLFIALLVVWQEVRRHQHDIQRADDKQRHANSPDFKEANGLSECGVLLPFFLFIY